jgi:hypothetical protein
LPRNHQDTINALLGQGKLSEVLLASEVGARFESGRFLADILIKHRAECGNIHRKYYFITFCCDDGNTSDRKPVGRVEPFKGKVYRAFKGINFDAIGVVEVHPLMNYPGDGKGRTLMYHVHAIGWSDTRRDPKTITAELLKIGTWKNTLGAQPIKIQLIGDRPEDLAALAHYMFKPPHAAKNRMPSKTKSGKFLLMDTTEGYRAELAMRVIEGLSQMELMHLVFGVNGGSEVRQPLRASIMRWHRARIKGGVHLDKQTDIWGLWYELRKEHGSKHFAPYRFMGSSGILPTASRFPKRGIRPTGKHKKSAITRMRRFDLDDDADSGSKLSDL